MSARMPRMDPHERATSCWYRVAGLVSREQKDLAVEIIEAEIRSAEYELLLEVSRLERRPDRDRPAAAGASRTGHPADRTHEAVVPRAVVPEDHSLCGIWERELRTVRPTGGYLQSRSPSAGLTPVRTPPRRPLWRQ